MMIDVCTPQQTLLRDDVYILHSTYAMTYECLLVVIVDYKALNAACAGKLKISHTRTSK